MFGNNLSVEEIKDLKEMLPQNVYDHLVQTIKDGVPAMEVGAGRPENRRRMLGRQSRRAGGEGSAPKGLGWKAGVRCQYVAGKDCPGIAATNGLTHTYVHHRSI